MRITVEEATTPEDEPSFERLVLEYVASLPFSLEFQAVSTTSSRTSLTSTVPPAGCALVAELDGEPVGCAGHPGVGPGRRRS